MSLKVDVGSASYFMLLNHLTDFVTQLRTSAEMQREFCNRPDTILRAWGLPIAPGIFTPPLSLENSALPIFPRDYSVQVSRLFVKDLESRRPLDTKLGSEISWFRLGLKPLLRLCIDEDQLSGVLRLCAECSACLLIAPFVMRQVHDSGKGGFSNSIRCIESLSARSSDGLVVYLAQSLEQSILIWLSELLGLHSATGRLLGYPECCVRFYEANLSEANSTLQGDFVLLSLRNTKSAPPFPFYTNNLLRYWGASLISHFPCSYSCLQSIEAGYRRFQQIDAMYHDAAQSLRAQLIGHTLYSEDQGVFRFEDGACLDGEFRFQASKVHATTDSTILARSIQASNRLVFSDSGICLFRDIHPVGVLKLRASLISFS